MCAPSSSPGTVQSRWGSGNCHQHEMERLGIQTYMHCCCKRAALASSGQRVSQAACSGVIRGEFASLRASVENPADMLIQHPRTRISHRILVPERQTRRKIGVRCVGGATVPLASTVWQSARWIVASADDGLSLITQNPVFPGEQQCLANLPLPPPHLQVRKSGTLCNADAGIHDDSQVALHLLPAKKRRPCTGCQLDTLDASWTHPGCRGDCQSQAPTLGMWARQSSCLLLSCSRLKCAQPLRHGRP